MTRSIRNRTIAAFDQSSLAEVSSEVKPTPLAEQPPIAQESAEGGQTTFTFQDDAGNTVERTLRGRRIVGERLIKLAGA